MEDHVLTARLDALRNSLGIVASNLESNKWQREGSTRTELLDEALKNGGNSARGRSLWRALDALLIEINKRINFLNSIDEALSKAAPDEQAALSGAWVDYGNGLRDSQHLLRSYREIIGSLAIRNQDLDNQLLYVADELIRVCMTVSISDDNYHLLVHSVIFSDAFSQTHARIIRLRFPAWTIWNLPLVAHEVGQVAHAWVLKQERDHDNSAPLLTSFMANQRAYLIANDACLKKLHQSVDDDPQQSDRRLRAEDWADSRLRVLLADVFATYTMGPAYACSAIMLRLNPTAEPQRDMPADVQRAHVILSTLRCMNEVDGPLLKTYDNVIKLLEDSWGKALDQGTPGSKLTDSDTEHLKQLAKTFTRDVAPNTFTTSAQYPKDGWKKAEQWAKDWLDQFKEGKFDVPRVQRGIARCLKCRVALSPLHHGQFPGRESGAQRLSRSCHNSVSGNYSPGRRNTIRWAPRFSAESRTTEIVTFGNCYRGN